MFFGATVLGAIGFGIGIVSMPVLLLALDPQSAVVMMNTLALGLELVIVVQSRKHLPFREIGPVGLAGVAGVPIAVFMLASLDIAALRLIIAALILVFAAVTGFNLRIRMVETKAAGIVAGFIVGVILPAFGVGGQLVALYALTRNWSNESTRAAMAFYLLLLDVAAIIGYGIAGLYTTERVSLIGVAIVPVIAGLALGSLIMRRMNERLFRYAALFVIVVSALAVVAREIYSLSTA